MNPVRFVTLAHKIMSEHLKKGDFVIDATVGNGKDTLFLAKTVGPSGKVFGFDVQEQAINNTKKLIGNYNNVHLIQDCHSNIKKHVNELVAGVMFNLGFLPGSDKKTITKKETTIQALNSALELLKPEGLITVVLYPHDEGKKEARAIMEWAKKHKTKHFAGSNDKSPSLLVIHK